MKRFPCEVCGWAIQRCSAVDFKVRSHGTHAHHLWPKEYGGDPQGPKIFLCPNHHIMATMLLDHLWGEESGQLRSRDGLLAWLREMERDWVDGGTNGWVTAVGT